MFQIGQTLYTKTNSHHGVVVDIDGDTVYLEQKNGVEIDFPASQLTAEKPLYPWEVEQQKKAAAEAAIDASAAQILEHLAGPAGVAAIAYNRLPFRAQGGFDSLKPSQKLNFMAVAYQISIEDIVKAHLEGKMYRIEMIMCALIARSVAV